VSGVVKLSENTTVRKRPASFFWEITGKSCLTVVALTSLQVKWHSGCRWITSGLNFFYKATVCGKGNRGFNIIESHTAEAAGCV